MLIPTFACFFCIFVTVGVADSPQDYCKAWDQSIRDADRQRGLTMTCVKSPQSTCTAIDCAVTYHLVDSRLSFLKNVRAEVDFCLGIAFYVDAKVMDMYIDAKEEPVQWKKRFYNGRNYSHTMIPGAEYQIMGGGATLRPILNVTFSERGSTSTIQVDLRIDVELPFDYKLTPLSLSRRLVSVKLDNSGHQRATPPSEIYHNSHCNIPTGKPKTDPPPSVTTPGAPSKSKTHGKDCKLDDLHSCQEPENCVYRTDIGKSVCQCSNGAPLKPNGLCGPVPSTTTYPAKPGNKMPPPYNSTKNTDNSSQTVGIAVGVTVSVVVVAAIVVVVVLFIRRRRNNPYANRELLLTGDDDDDDDPAI